MILGAFLNWSFTGDLISALLNRVTILPFKDIATLVQNTNYLISVYPDSTQEDRFRLSKDKYDQIAYEERIKPFLKDFDKSYRGNSTITANFHSFIQKQNNLITISDVNYDEYNTIIPTKNPRYALYTFEMKAR